MNKPKNVGLALVGLFMLACGGGSAEVGTGEPFSTLSTAPTAVQLYQAISNGIASYTTQTRIKARLQFGGNFGGDDSITDEDQFECEGGGTMVIKSKIGTTGLSSSAELKDCSITIAVGTGTFTEKLSGKISEAMKVSSSNADVTNEEAASVSVSGDLGFAFVCDLSSHQSALDFNPESEGDCVFFDVEETELTANGEEIEEFGTTLIPVISF